MWSIYLIKSYSFLLNSFSFGSSVKVVFWVHPVFHFLLIAVCPNIIEFCVALNQTVGWIFILSICCSQLRKMIFYHILIHKDLTTYVLGNETLTKIVFAEYYKKELKDLKHQKKMSREVLPHFTPAVSWAKENIKVLGLCSQ